jgi:hypothetical protein
MTSKEFDISVVGDPSDIAEKQGLMPNGKIANVKARLRAKMGSVPPEVEFQLDGSYTRIVDDTTTLDMFQGEGARAKKAKKEKTKTKGKGYSKTTSSLTTGQYKSCYKDHPLLPIEVDGVTYHVSGGSCHYPPEKDGHLDMDVFVGLDSYMTATTMAFPWEPGIAFLYPITDMQAPKDPKTFKKLLGWLARQIKAGKRVHIGCIGGHGRTGTVLAALVTYMTGELDSINYVRKHYCKKAVEADTQINFLHEHFGITKVEPSKTYSIATTDGGYYGGGKGYSQSYYEQYYGGYDSSKKFPMKKSIKSVQVSWTLHGVDTKKSTSI